ncbi:hypothetical protein GCM10027187_01080 [Streptosporangium sandarakinum]
MRSEDDDSGEFHERKLSAEAAVPVEVMVTELTGRFDHCSLKGSDFIGDTGESEPPFAVRRVDNGARQVLDVTKVFGLAEVGSGHRDSVASGRALEHVGYPTDRKPSVSWRGVGDGIRIMRGRAHFSRA